LHRIARYPEDARAFGVEARREVAEIARFHGAAGGVVLRIEVQHQPAPGVVGKPRLAAVGKGESKVGNRVAGLDHRGQNFIGSRIASRLRWSQNSRKSSRSAAMCIEAGMPTVSCAENMSAPVCMAR